jgi:hypothetical protein
MFGAETYWGRLLIVFLGAGKWELMVLGKNGVTVDDKICLPGGEPVYLQSGSYLQMGDRSFYFLLPIDEDQCVSYFVFLSSSLPLRLFLSSSLPVFLSFSPCGLSGSVSLCI